MIKKNWVDHVLSDTVRYKFLERWIDLQEEFADSNLRTIGSFLVCESDVVLSLEFIPTCAFFCDAWKTPVKQAISILENRNVSVLQLSYPAHPYKSWEWLGTSVKNMEVDFRKAVYKRFKYPTRHFNPRPESYLETAKRYASLTKILGLTLITPNMSGLFRESIRKTVRSRKRYNQYNETLETIHTVVSGFRDLGFDPAALGFEGLSSDPDYQRLMARRVSIRLEETTKKSL